MSVYSKIQVATTDAELDLVVDGRELRDPVEE